MREQDRHKKAGRLILDTIPKNFPHTHATSGVVFGQCDCHEFQEISERKSSFLISRYSDVWKELEPKHTGFWRFAMLLLPINGSQKSGCEASRSKP